MKLTLFRKLVFSSLLIASPMAFSGTIYSETNATNGSFSSDQDYLLTAGTNEFLGSIFLETDILSTGAQTAEAFSVSVGLNQFIESILVEVGLNTNTGDNGEDAESMAYGRYVFEFQDYNFFKEDVSSATRADYTFQDRMSYSGEKLDVSLTAFNHIYLNGDMSGNSPLDYRLSFNVADLNVLPQPQPQPLVADQVSEPSSILMALSALGFGLIRRRLNNKR